MMPPKHEPPDVRRAQLLEAAAAVWAEKGYHATRIDDIAGRAGLSKGAVYHHFGSKLEIFTAVAEGMMNELVVMVRAANAAGASIAATLEELTRAAELMVATEGMLLGFVDLYTLSLRDDVLRSRLRAQYQAMVDAVTALFERGVESGELRPGAPATATVFLTTLDGIFLVSPIFEEPDFIPRQMRAWVDLILHGLLARPKGERS